MNRISVGLVVLLLVSPAAAGAAGRAPHKASHVAASGAAGARVVKLFVIALDDGGRSGKKIGCNDSVVSVTKEVSPRRAPLRAALEELLKLSEKAGPGQQMHNALHQSKLTLRRVAVRRGEAVVHLAGSLVTGGVCDAPRVQAQLEETARQFPSVRRVRVFINGTPLASYLSERG